MAIRNASVFLTLKEEGSTEVELKTFPEPIIANIIRDVDSGQLIEVDEVIWNYVTQPPPGANGVAVPQPPPPEAVYLEIRLAPNQTPFLQPTSLLPSPGESEIVEADAASYGNVGTVPITPNPPRLDSATAAEGETQQTEVEDGFEYQVRDYKYAVILTTQNNVYTLDPKLRIRSRHRRVQS